MSSPIELTKLEASTGISVANETGAVVADEPGAEAVGAGVGDDEVGDDFGAGEDAGAEEAALLGVAVADGVDPFDEEPLPEPFDGELPPEPFEDELPPVDEMLGVGADPPPPEQPISDAATTATAKYERRDRN